MAIDLAKNSFQVCGVGSDGVIAVSRPRLYQLLAEQDGCVVAMEACVTSHPWGRVAQSYRHVAHLIPANYVKPFVKRQKNDRPDAEAISEVAVRPSMRFVTVKSAEKQGRAVDYAALAALDLLADRGAYAAPPGPRSSLTIPENPSTFVGFQASHCRSHPS